METYWNIPIWCCTKTQGNQKIIQGN